MTATATTYQTLTLERMEQTVRITLNRPKALNALSRTVLEELKAALEVLQQDATVRGIILTGAGEKAFVAGADISEIQALNPEDAIAFSRFGQALFDTIEQFPKPIIAAVNGFALGGGCELAMACHMRIASDKARFGQPEVNLGIIAGYGGTQRLPRLIGRAKGLELLLTGDMLNAEQALELGLANYVVPTEQLMDKCMEVLNKIYAKAPLAITYTIDSVNAGYDPSQNGYHVEATNFARAANTADAHEGTTAFLEKRKPDFAGQ